MRLRSPNVTWKCYTVSSGNPFILGLEGQGHESHELCRRTFLHPCGCWLLLVNFCSEPRLLNVTFFTVFHAELAFGHQEGRPIKNLPKGFFQRNKSKRRVSVCLSVCVSVSLFFMRVHSFERICRKFGTWHRYNLRMSMGRLASAARARRLALRAPSVYATANGWRALSGNSRN